MSNTKSKITERELIKTGKSSGHSGHKLTNEEAAFIKNILYQVYEMGDNSTFKISNKELLTHLIFSKL